jgi:hypothetical protein
MDQYLTLCGVTTDDQKVAVASSYLKEAAFAWWENRCRQPFPPRHDWLAFCAAVKERFQPLAASRTARAQLRSLQQGSMTVHDYSNKFYSIVQLIPDMSDADQVETFVHSLRRAIAREVDMREPKTLNEAMTTAQKVETLLDNYRHYNHPTFGSRISTTTSTYSPYPASASSSSSSSAPSSAMELGNLNTDSSSLSSYGSASASEWSTDHENEYNRYVDEGETFEPKFDMWDEIEPEIYQKENMEQLQAMQQRSGRVPFLPREEFTRCMKERLCLRCKAPGHIARNCTLPRPLSSTSSTQPKRNFH